MSLILRVKVIPIVHKSNKRLLVQFPYDLKLISIIKKIEGAAWSQTHRSWHVPDDQQSIDKVLELFKDIAEVECSAVSSVEGARIRKSSRTESKQSNVNYSDRIIIEVIGKRFL